jgi:hypothetical protein
LSNDGQAVLVMRWLTKGQLISLVFALSGLTEMNKDLPDNKVNAFVTEGLKMAAVPINPGRGPLGVVTGQVEQQQSLLVTMGLFKILAFCGRAEWRNAQSAIEDAWKELRLHNKLHDNDVSRYLLYLDAMCRQGQGDLKAALEAYSSPVFAFEPDSKADTADKDIRALAALNSVSILRRRGDKSAATANSLLDQVEGYCSHHRNKAIVSAFYMLKSLNQDSNIVTTKQLLQPAVKKAKESDNKLLQCLTMNIVTSRFFGTAVIGPEVEKATKVARTFSVKLKSELWCSVADGMYSDIMDRCGRPQDSDAARQQGLALLEKLPPALKKDMAENDKLLSRPRVAVAVDPGHYHTAGFAMDMDGH